MNKLVLAVVATIGVQAAFAAPTANIQSLSATEDVPHVVTVTYTLSEDAVVTMGVKTNGAPVADAALWSAGGDVNRRVKATGAGEVRTIIWCPDATFEGHSFDGKDVSVELTAWSLQTPPDYLVADLRVPSNITYYVSAEAVPGGVQDVRYKGDCLLMRKIPAKNVSWVMGVSENYKDVCSEDQFKRALLHKVKLTHDYYYGVYQVTVAQYGLIMNLTESSSHLPQSRINFNDLRGSETGAQWPSYDADGNFDPVKSHAVASGRAIEKIRTLTGLRYLDLPTEAQREFASRAGDSGMLPYNEKIGNKANFDKYGRCGLQTGVTVPPDCEGKTEKWWATVGTYKPNRWGVYEVVCNGIEWCLDRYENWSTCNDGGPIDPFAEQVDPVGPKTGAYRVARGNQPDDYFYNYGCGLPLSRKGWEPNKSQDAYMTFRFALTLY